MLTVLKSGNAKIGISSATYRGRQSCPSDCRLKLLNLCYAENYPLGYQFSRAGVDFEQDASKVYSFIKNLPFARKVRHLVSGDLFTNDKLDWPFIKNLIKGHRERPDVIGWAYTHGFKRFRKNPFKLKNLVVNASCDFPSDVAKAKKRGFNTVLVVPETIPSGKSEYKGIKGLLCPAQTSDRLVKAGKTNIKVTCEKCLICAKDRDLTIFFAVHGTKKKNFKE